MKQNEISREFSEFAQCYDEIVTGELGYTAHQVLPAHIVAALGSKAADVLDLGCGTGISSDLFFQKGYTVTGVDIAPGMIDKAKQRPFKKLVCQCLETPLPFKSASFDATVALGVMEFIQGPKQFLKEVVRVLKPGGLLAITFPRNKPAESSLPVRSYQKVEINTWLSSLNLKILSCQNLVGYVLDGQTINYWGYVAVTPS